MDSQATYRNSMQPEGPGFERRGLFCVSSLKVLCLYAMLLTAALGLVFGASFAVTILTALAAIIVFAVVMAVLIVATLIYRCHACHRF